MKTLTIIAACLLAVPASAQTLVGSWQCESSDATAKTTTKETFAKNGRYTTEFNIDATTQGQKVALVGKIKGKYEMIGPLLNTTPGKIDLIEANVGGQNLMKSALKDQIAESVRDTLPSAKTSQTVTELTDKKMVIGSGDTATLCRRLK